MKIMYTKLDFCIDLISLIRQKATDREISLWAARVGDSNYKNCDKELIDYFCKLELIEEPEFKMATKDLVHICIDMLTKYYAEIYGSKK